MGETDTSGAIGVHGVAPATRRANYIGVKGDGGIGVRGDGSSTGVEGVSGSGNGVQGSSTNANGVQGKSDYRFASGVYGENLQQGWGVAGRSTADDPLGLQAAVFGETYFLNTRNRNPNGLAGHFRGAVHITGMLQVDGLVNKTALAFKIDHPLDPPNQYLLHFGVESPDMMNVYNGNVSTDAEGNATVELPGYFEALNRDFRYQLTPIGEFGQAIVAEEVKDNRFTIKTDKPNVRVSWQITGIRQDAWANAHPMEVEVEKPEGERGNHLTPEEHGQPKTASIYQLDFPVSDETETDRDQTHGE